MMLAYVLGRPMPSVSRDFTRVPPCIGQVVGSRRAQHPVHCSQCFTNLEGRERLVSIFQDCLGIVSAFDVGSEKPREDDLPTTQRVKIPPSRVNVSMGAVVIADLRISHLWRRFSLIKS